jgi:hypothetical protein
VGASLRGAGETRRGSDSPAPSGETARVSEPVTA